MCALTTEYEEADQQTEVGDNWLVMVRVRVVVIVVMTATGHSVLARKCQDCPGGRGWPILEARSNIFQGSK